jgi:hypothetical protein
MKKLWLFIVSAIFIFSILIFIFIPGKIVVAESRVVGTTDIGFDTCLHKLEKWKQWWPGKSIPSGNDSVFIHDGYSYKLLTPYTDGATLEIKSGNISAGSRIQTIFANRDSVIAEWRISLQSGYNPFKRLSNYWNAKKLKQSMKVVFDSLCYFAGKTENIYGYPIERTTFTEVNLIAYRFKSALYPTTTAIYNAVKQLRQYLTGHGATEKYYPMMNTKQVDSSYYETMIAISIDRVIPESREYFMSKMVPMKDRFLSTDVTGGPASIEKACHAIEKYMANHSLTAPARPFEILVTDRSAVTDTAAWKTKIFYPSM